MRDTNERYVLRGIRFVVNVHASLEAGSGIAANNKKQRPPRVCVMRRSFDALSHQKEKKKT
jgi:hypothetical protein